MKAPIILTLIAVSLAGIIDPQLPPPDITIPVPPPVPSPPSLPACLCAIVDVAIAGGVVVLRAAMPAPYSVNLDIAIKAGIAPFKFEIGCGPAPSPLPTPAPDAGQHDCADIVKAISMAEQSLRKGLSMLPGFTMSEQCNNGVMKGIKAFKYTLGCKQVGDCRVDAGSGWAESPC